MLLFATDLALKASKAYTLPSNWRRLGKRDVALVTGGLGGLGIEIVKKLIFNYKVSKVIVLDVKKPKFNFDHRVEFFQCDLAVASELKTAVEKIIRDLSRTNQHISVLVNNAGVRNSGPLLYIKEDDILQAFGVNILAPISILRMVIANHIKNHILSQLYVVSVSSVLGILAPKNLLVYAATKAAIIQVHESLTQELKAYKSIRLLLVTPGQLTTDMFADVSPSRLFFAPLVNHIALAGAIVEKISTGETGELCEPLYANFLSIVKTLPLILQQACRWFSGMDEKVTDIMTK